MHTLVRFLALAGSLASTMIATGSEQPNTRTTAPPPATAANQPRDQAFQLLGDAGRAYRNVNDYTCLFIKRERLRGRLQAEQLVDMKVRTQPFSVYMRWVGPKDLEGQQACFSSARSSNTFRARGTGISGIAGFVTLDLRDPRAMENNRHTINEAGIGNLITRLQQRWEASQRTNATEFRIAEYTYNQRPCMRVETIHAPQGRTGMEYYRSVIYFDRENRLPIRIENYDWPRQGGDPNGDLLECYSYVNLQLNTGIREAVFNQ